MLDLHRVLESVGEGVIEGHPLRGLVLGKKGGRVSQAKADGMRVKRTHVPRRIFAWNDRTHFVSRLKCFFPVEYRKDCFDVASSRSTLSHFHFSTTHH